MTDKSKPASAAALREARLAAALRENLKRRKSQARARTRLATAGDGPEKPGRSGVSPQSGGE